MFHNDDSAQQGVDVDNIVSWRWFSEDKIPGRRGDAARHGGKGARGVAHSLYSVRIPPLHGRSDFTLRKEKPKIKSQFVTHDP